ncbi:MAG: valine--tRNA ligase [Bacteroidota bacterium]
MKREFAKAYQPRNAETKWYEIWQNNGMFSASNKSEKPSYSILMPPPNVTGMLHFGHVLNHTLQDMYIRNKRMNGYEVCWFPGMDHAGIATQTRVEKEIKKEENLTRYDLGREKFIDKVWEWKEKYGGIILKQLKSIGVSCDWERTLFTMDESASRAVEEVFIRLFDEGLIYKGERIINWSPLSRTALSDEEVEFREVSEQLYTLKYYLEGSDKDYLKVATVRTETIFGDIAVAVNPNDERYKKYLGKKVIVPLVNRAVPVIADEHADPEFGTGVVKITPAHDPNDFEVGKRHKLETINAINPDATLNHHAGEFAGMDRFEARKAVVKKLDDLKLIEKKEDYTHNIGFSQRGGEPVEPYLSSQWFVKMEPFADIALKPVMDGEIKFHPSHWTKTYEHWLKNIRDWCISRQLWWGHRIPVYYTEDGNYTAASSKEEALKKLGLPAEEPLTRDPDVLDTWFSSWLWPMTTMKWLHDGKTEETDDLKKFLPSDLLVTAPDIIFFWVARMIMASEKFKKEIPFKHVYFTSLIRDGMGRKLSKSLGNSPDPLNIIEKYGADAVRFTMIYLSPMGQDVKMDVDVEQQDIPSMEVGRNFANKVWNAGRFLLMKFDAEQINEVCPANIGRGLKDEELSYADKWILSRYNSTIEKLSESLNNYKVNDYSKQLYEFVWNDFCDWYIEAVKVQLNRSESPSYRQALIKFAFEVYDGILRLLHPVMPFITEEIWHIINDKPESDSISLQNIPEANKDLIRDDIESKFNLLQSIVEEIRSLRNTTSLAPSKKIPALIGCPDTEMRHVLENQQEAIKTFARCSEIEIKEKTEKPEGSLASVAREIEIFIILGEDIDFKKEEERIVKEIERLERNIFGTNKKLSNENFLNNAPPDVVVREKEKLKSMEESLKKVKENLESLKAGMK